MIGLLTVINMDVCLCVHSVCLVSLLIVNYIKMQAKINLDFRSEVKQQMKSFWSLGSGSLGLHFTFTTYYVNVNESLNLFKVSEAEMIEIVSHTVKMRIK